MQVDFSPHFLRLLNTLDKQSQDMIAEFVDYVEQNGLRGLQGRNKSSAPNNPHTKKNKPILIMPKNIVFGIIISAYLIMSVNMAI